MAQRLNLTNALLNRPKSNNGNPGAAVLERVTRILVAITAKAAVATRGSNGGMLTKGCCLSYDIRSASSLHLGVGLLLDGGRAAACAGERF